MEEKGTSLAFLRRTMGFMRMKVVMPSSAMDNLTESDRGLKEKIFSRDAYEELRAALSRLSRFPYSITQYTDGLGVSSILVNAGEQMEKATLLMIGPFVEDDDFGVTLRQKLEKLGYPETVYPVLKQYVEAIPYYSTDMLDPIIQSMLEDDTGKLFSFNTIGSVSKERLDEYSKADSFTISKDSYDLIAERYRHENIMLSYVKQGDMEKATEALRSLINLGVKQKRVENFLQNSKNYLIVLNTILRKAVEEAGVHPVYIDYYSSAFAIAINHAQTNASLINMGYDMVEKYTRLVSEKALGHLSPVIKDIVLYIDFHQRDDLSLSFFSDYCNVSKNYLSNLFHKEMGMPLTEYVRDFRMKRAARLLLNSSLTLTDIAVAVGYDNPNYFIRHFKQVYAITPKQYQKENGSKK